MISSNRNFAVCNLCPHHCHLKEGASGICRARKCVEGKVVSSSYGNLSALALDPIEKKPLYHFHKGSQILSVGSFGCNLKCPFCQNHEISMGTSTHDNYYAPDDIVDLALKLKHECGNIGVAFTYNEPLISYEYVLDTARLLKQADLCTVLVTNGTICEEPFLTLLPYIDALNIDLKAFSPHFYRKIKGDFDTVLNNIRLAHEFSHVEITTLVIDGVNDSDEDMERECQFLCSIDKEMPLHLSRCFPRYRWSHIRITPYETLERLLGIAQKYLHHVYLGNV